MLFRIPYLLLISTFSCLQLFIQFIVQILFSPIFDELSICWVIFKNVLIHVHCSSHCILDCNESNQFFSQGHSRKEINWMKIQQKRHTRICCVFNKWLDSLHFCIKKLFLLGNDLYCLIRNMAQLLIQVLR